MVLTDNQFFTGLTNLALFMRLYATNTSRFADDFVDSFATDTLANGDRKIFHFSDLPQVKDYSETSSLLSVTKVDTNEEYIVVTERKVIPSSFNKFILTQAFTSDSGMNEFMGYLLGQMESAKTNYIYNKIITDIFAKEFTGDRLKEITLLDENAQTNVTDLNNAQIINQKRIYLAVRDIVQNIQVYNNKYNAKGYTQALDPKDMRFLYCNPYANENVVNLFASLLNSSELTKDYEKPITQVIPSISITPQNSKVVGFLMHKYSYQFFYKFTFMGSFFDASNLVINNFLHFWLGAGWLDNLPAVKFMEKQGA